MKLEKLMKILKRKWMSLPKKQQKALMRFHNLERKSMSQRLSLSLRSIISNLKSMETLLAFKDLIVWVKLKKDKESSTSENN